MSLSTPAKVNGKDGLRGTLDIDSLPPAGQEGKVILLLEGGTRVLVPRDILEKQPDGTYYLPLSVADLQSTTGSRGGEQIVMPLVEEHLETHKRQVETGRLRVHKLVREHEELLDEPLLHEEVEIERVRVNRPVDTPLPARREGDTLIVPIFEEVLVVEKRLVLSEELRITTRRTEERETHRVTLRSEEAQIERLPGAGAEEDHTSTT